MTIGIKLIDILLTTPHGHFNSEFLSFEAAAILRMIMVHPPIKDEHPIVLIIHIQLCCQVLVP
jgi:hypothetical protein